MSDRDTLPGTGGDWEQRLRTGLRDLEAGTPGGGGLPGADQVRRTHVRRRTALAVAAALATVAVAGGTVLALDRPGTSAPSIPANPSPSATAAPEPTTTDPSPSSPPATPETSAPQTSAPPAGTVPTTIPDDYRLPHEGSESDDPWTLVDSLQISCGPEEISFADLSDSRVLARNGPEYGDVEALLVYADVQDALAVMTEARALADCVPSADGRISVTPVEGPWGEAVVVAVVAPEGGIGGSYWLLARTGTGVAVVGTTGEMLSAELPDPGIVAELQDAAAPIATELCLYTEAGC